MSDLNEMLFLIINEIAQGKLKSQEQIKASIHKLIVKASVLVEQPFNADLINDRIKALLKVVSENINKNESNREVVEFYKEILSDSLTIFPGRLLEAFILSEKSELSDTGYLTLAKRVKGESINLITTYHPIIVSIFIRALEKSFLETKRIGKSTDSLLNDEPEKKAEDATLHKRGFSFFNLKNPHTKKTISKSEENLSSPSKLVSKKIYLNGYLYSIIEKINNITLEFPKESSKEKKIEYGLRYYREIKNHLLIIMSWLTPESPIVFSLEEIKNVMHTILNKLGHLYIRSSYLDIKKPGVCFSPIQSSHFLKRQETLISNRELLSEVLEMVTSIEHINALEENLQTKFELIGEELTKAHVHDRVKALIEQDMDYILIALNAKKEDLSFFYKQKNLLLGRLNASLGSPNLSKEQKLLMESLINKKWCDDSIYLEFLNELICLRVFVKQFVMSELLQPIIDIAIFEILFECQSTYPEHKFIANNLKHFVELFKNTYLKSAGQNELSFSKKSITAANKDYFEDSPLNLEAGALKNVLKKLEEIQGDDHENLIHYRNTLHNIFNDLHIRICQSLAEFNFTQNEDNVPEKLRLVISLFYIVAENYYKENKKERFIFDQLFNNEFERFLLADSSKKSHVLSMSH